MGGALVFLGCFGKTEIVITIEGYFFKKKII
jgi:hypothetical protein